MYKQKGFTIIELIVVIAIIAILAAIVMMNVTGYINKGKDAAARGDLATLQANAIIFNSDSTKGNGTFNGFLSDPTYTQVSTALTNLAYTLTSKCNDTNGLCATTNATTWCASVPLKADTTKSYCVDSSGNKKEAASETCASGACP